MSCGYVFDLLPYIKAGIVKADYSVMWAWYHQCNFLT